MSLNLGCGRHGCVRKDICVCNECACCHRQTEAGRECRDWKLFIRKEEHSFLLTNRIVAPHISSLSFLEEQQQFIELQQEKIDEQQQKIDEQQQLIVKLLQQIAELTRVSSCATGTEV